MTDGGPRRRPPCFHAGVQDTPTSLDLGFQLAYRIAHRLLSVSWFLRRPRSRGVLVAVWHAGDLLIAKNSYRRQFTLPGGYQHRGETAEQTGARELFEECGIGISAERLSAAYRGVHAFEFRQDDVTLVEAELNLRPAISVDHREVVWARFEAPAEIEKRDIVPQLREYLEHRRSGGAG